jgi:hypothetical protein
MDTEFCADKSYAMSSFARLRHRWMDTTEINLKVECCVGVDCRNSCSGLSLVASSYVHDYSPLGYINDKEFLD